VEADGAGTSRAKNFALVEASAKLASGARAQEKNARSTSRWNRQTLRGKRSCRARSSSPPVAFLPAGLLLPLIALIPAGLLLELLLALTIPTNLLLQPSATFPASMCFLWPSVARALVAAGEERRLWCMAGARGLSFLTAPIPDG